MWKLMNISHSYAYLNWLMLSFDRVNNYESMAEGYGRAEAGLLDSFIRG